MDDYDEEFSTTTYSRWRSSVECEPYYSKYRENIYMRYTSEGPLLGSRINNSDIYIFELDRKHSVAEVLDRIMGGV